MADIDAVNNTETPIREEGAVPVDAQEANPLTDGLPTDNNLGGNSPPPLPQILSSMTTMRNRQ